MSAASNVYLRPGRLSPPNGSVSNRSQNGQELTSDNCMKPPAHRGLARAEHVAQLREVASGVAVVVFEEARRHGTLLSLAEAADLEADRSASTVPAP